MEFVNNLVSFQYKKHLLIESKIYTPKVIVRIEQNKGCTARVIKEPKLETMDSFGLFFTKFSENEPFVLPNELLMTFHGIEDLNLKSLYMNELTHVFA